MKTETPNIIRKIQEKEVELRTCDAMRRKKLYKEIEQLEKEYKKQR
jgi:hypothetical protein